MTAIPKLLQPLKVSNLQLKHRVVLAPLTRYRANAAHVHGDLAVEYYSQRSSTPGTLLITEATFISPEAGGYGNVPGLWNNDQVAAWKRVTDAVHANGSYIFAQLWALGRAAKSEVLETEVGGPYDVVSASDIGLKGHAKPRPLTVEEIATYREKYIAASKNAIAAGFDGVEIHNANGYLLDQFLQDVSNKRSDHYGGSIENRARFSLEVVEAVTSAIGPERTAIRISPWGLFQDMRMKDPVPTYSYFVDQLVAKYPSLAYLSVIEARPAKDGEPEDALGRSLAESNDFIRQKWAPRPLVSAGGYSESFGKDLALKAGEQGVAVAFGRSFIANPDLPVRIKKGIELTVADPAHFYIVESATGYIDYPFANGKKLSNL